MGSALPDNAETNWAQQLSIRSGISQLEIHHKILVHR